MSLHRALKVCVVIPAYNESTVIKSVLRGIPKTIKVGNTTVQLTTVVIDDGSTDNTVKIARSIPGVIVLQHLLNLGAGAATRTGLHYAERSRFDMAITMDADGQHAPSDLVVLLKSMMHTPGVDLLIGTRLRGIGYMPTHRRVGNRLFSVITLLLFGTLVSDSQSGFRVFSKKALQMLSFHSNGYAFCSEMLWQARRAKLIVAEHPIEAIYSSYSLAKGQKSYSGALKIVQQIVVQRFMEFIS